MPQREAIEAARALNHREVVEWLRAQASHRFQSGARAQTLIDTAAVLERLGPCGIQPSKGNTRDTKARG